MPVPKRKRSKSRRDSRFANKGLQPKAFTECVNCQEIIMPHRICPKCGFYKGEKIMKTKLDRSITRTEVRAKQMSKASAQNPEVVQEQN